MGTPRRDEVLHGKLDQRRGVLNNWSLKVVAEWITPAPDRRRMMSGYDYSQDVANEMLEESHAENTKLEAENAALRAELAALRSGDVVMVPREPTKTMIDTCLEEHGFYCWDVWETLINAAPGVQAGEKDNAGAHREAACGRSAAPEC